MVSVGCSCISWLWDCQIFPFFSELFSLSTTFASWETGSPPGADVCRLKREGTASLLQISSSRPLCVEAARLQSWSTVGSQVRLVHFRRERALRLQVSSSRVRWPAGNAGSDYFEPTMKDCLLCGDHLPRGFCTQGAGGSGPEMLGEGALFTKAGRCLFAGLFNQLSWASKVGLETVKDQSFSWDFLLVLHPVAPEISQE